MNISFKAWGWVKRKEVTTREGKRVLILLGKGEKTQ